MLNSRFAGIPISSSTIDGPGVPQLMNRGEQTLRTVTGSGGRLHFGMVAGIKSERWPTSNRNPWPDCLGIRTAQFGRAKASVAVGSSGFGSVQPRAGILVLIAHNPEKIVQWRRGAFHRLLTYPLPHCYSIAPMVSRAMRAR